jgi:teichuronic acid biosynthesis glycosyltransferase TuaC
MRKLRASAPEIDCVTTMSATSGTAQRLKIASVCRLLPTPQDPAAGTFILNRLAAMSELSDVSVFQPVPFFPGVAPRPSWSQTPKRVLGALEIEHAPMFYIPGVLKSLDGKWLGRSIRPALEQLKKRGAVEAIDAHFGYPEGVGCARVGQQLGIPYFITIRGLETDVLKRPEVRDQLLDAMHGAAGLISVSHSLKELVVSNGVDANKVLVAPNAVDRSRFSPGDRAAARQQLGLGDEPLIVSVGHLLSVKRHSVLIDAFAAIRERTNAKLVIIGGPSYEPRYPTQLREQVARLGLDEHVRFAGKLPPAEVVMWLRAANVFSLASAREGCCNAVLEALAAGLPVVATRVGDNPHFVQEDENGFLADPDDASGLARQLERGLSRDWDAQEISAKLSVGTWRDTAARVLQFMESRIPATSRKAA